MFCAPGRRANTNNLARNRLAPNGRLPATLPEPIKRARDKDIRGFAGEGNVGERNERMRVKRTLSPTRISKGETRAGC